MEASRQGRLQHVIIGVAAGVFGGHRPALALPTVDLVAVSDINTEVGAQRASELQCAFYRYFVDQEKPIHRCSV